MNKARKIFRTMVLLLILAMVAYILYGIFVAGEIDLLFVKIPLDATVPTSIPGIWTSQISESEVEQYFEDKGFEFWSADISATEYRVEVNIDLMSDDLLATSIEDAAYLGSYLEGREPEMSSVSLDVYYIGYPLYRISGPVDALADAYEEESEDFIKIGRAHV